MSGEQVVHMVVFHDGRRATEARERLAECLGDAEVGEPGAEGCFDVRVEAADQEKALERVWEAMAAAGADDHIAFMEHPQLPEHWKARARPAS